MNKDQELMKYLKLIWNSVTLPIRENIFNENFRIRDKVDHLRTSGFLSKVIPVVFPDNKNEGVTDELKDTFSSYKQRIFDIVNS